MPRKTKPNYGYNAGFLVPEVVLDDGDIKELNEICDALGFVEAVTGAIGFFRGHKINELESSSVSEQRAALTELETLTNDLQHAIKALDSDTEEKIHQALMDALTNDLHHARNLIDSDIKEKRLKGKRLNREILQELNYELPKFLGSITIKLDRLSAGVELARRSIEGDTGAPAKESERVFVAVLADIFNQYDIEIAPDDIGITGTGFYQAVYIGLREGWPTEAEWPDKRKYAQPRESTVVVLIKEYLP